MTTPNTNSTPRTDAAVKAYNNYCVRVADLFKGEQIPATMTELEAVCGKCPTVEEEMAKLETELQSSLREVEKMKCLCLDVRDALGEYHRTKLQSAADKVEELAVKLQPKEWFDQWQKSAREHDQLKREVEELKRDVLELRLCEQEFIILQPGRLYRFTVDESCADCKRIAASVPN